MIDQIVSNGHLLSRFADREISDLSEAEVAALVTSLRSLADVLEVELLKRPVTDAIIDTDHSLERDESGEPDTTD